MLRKSTVTSQLLAPCNNTIARAKSRIPTKDESGIIRLSVSRFRVFAQSLGMNESEELYFATSRVFVDKFSIRSRSIFV